MLGTLSQGEWVGGRGVKGGGVERGSWEGGGSGEGWRGGGRGRREMRVSEGMGFRGWGE